MFCFHFWRANKTKLNKTQIYQAGEQTPFGLGENFPKMRKLEWFHIETQHWVLTNKTLIQPQSPDICLKQSLLNLNSLTGDAKT